MIVLDHAQQTHAIVIVAGLVLWVGFVTVGVLWRQAKELARLRGQVDDVRGWAWDVHGVLFGEDEPPAAEDEDGPPTVVSHPADLWARKAALLHRITHHGQHRA